MSGARFDILFDGTLKPGADPRLARERLQAAFKLDATGIERLFKGQRLTVKRNADAATAARYKRIFEEAGAIVTLRAVEVAASTQSPSPPTKPPLVADPEAGVTPKVTTLKTDTEAVANLTAEGGFEFLEEPPQVRPPDLDLSHLSLVNGSDWSLADCDRPPEPVHIPDISHLRLDEIETPPDDNEPTGHNPAP
ncbi:hypothetical protein [Thermochromatium tepidum]|uniref:Uncharacterized protein n=1 Tax=Thermochromatium tepidum ATCC 43061 TaxID=316276 RepID=A0A6I6EGM9_THETI|nr:hypothetical protein [Thermochromatium tepidum]QGU32477.1 hypothetical protein E6P07_05450 [Thermochromatium tepidum ATCC 43061]